MCFNLVFLRILIITIETASADKLCCTKHSFPTYIALICLAFLLNKTSLDAFLAQNICRINNRRRVSFSLLACLFSKFEQTCILPWLKTKIHINVMLCTDASTLYESRRIYTLHNKKQFLLFFLLLWMTCLETGCILLPGVNVILEFIHTINPQICKRVLSD